MLTSGDDVFLKSEVSNICARHLKALGGCIQTFPKVSTCVQRRRGIYRIVDNALSGMTIYRKANGCHSPTDIKLDGSFSRRLLS